MVGAVPQLTYHSCMSDQPATAFVLIEATSLLARTPASVRALLVDLPEAWVMAKRYRGEVGVWGEYSSVLKR